MRVNLDKPTPGSLSNQLFDLILLGTDISSLKVKEALRDYLVCGVKRQTAYESHGVSPSAFSLRLKRFKQEMERLTQIIRLCSPVAPHDPLTDTWAEVDALTKELKSKIDEALNMAPKQGFVK